MRVTVEGEDYDLRVVSSLSLTADKTLLNGAGMLVALAACETGGVAAASFDLLDGQDDNGSYLLPVRLAAGQSIRERYGLPGFPFTGGLQVHDLAGSVNVSAVVAIFLTMLQTKP